jgi:hypothetical protein
MAEVFISYARTDRVFARDLRDALKEEKRDPWVDWHSIPYSTKWHAEILAAIEAADNFLFIISLDSLRSWMCGEEVRHAVACKKRIITILYRPVDCEKLLHCHRFLTLLRSASSAIDCENLVGGVPVSPE